MLLGHGSLLRRPSNDQSWKNLNKGVIVVFDYNPNNKINIYVYRRIPVSGEEEIREIKKITIRASQYYCHKQDPQMNAKTVVRSLRRNRMFL